MSASNSPKTRGRRSTEATGSIFELDDLLYALENAAEFLENEQWPEPATKAAQEAANREGAKRIRRMMRRLANKSNARSSASPLGKGALDAD
jgi:hypothetical protein